MKSAKNKILILSTMLLAAGCTRQAELKELPNATVVRNATVTDKKLPIRPLPLKDIQASLKIPATNFSTVEYFRLIDSLKGLSQLTRDDQIGTLAKGLYDSFYANQGNYSQVSFNQSLVAHAIVGEGEPVIRTETERLKQAILDMRKKMGSMLEASKTTFPWPKKLQNVHEGIELADRYMAWVKAEIPKLELDPVMELGATDGIDKSYGEQRPTLVKLANDMERARNLDESLKVMSRAVKLLKINLSKDQKKRLEQGDELAFQIAAVEKPQDALTMLITVWRMTPPNERKEAFKSSRELYMFLLGKNDWQLSCLAKKHCMDPMLGMAKVPIFSSLNEYGLQRLARDVDNAARDSVKQNALNEFTANITGLPKSVYDGVVEGTQGYLDLIHKVQKDPVTFSRTHLHKWAQENFRQPLRGLEVDEVTVTLNGRGDIQVGPIQPVGQLMRTGAASLGASLSLAHQFLQEEDNNRLTASMVEPLMKLLAIGGFRISEGRVFPSFMLALDGALTDFFDLKKLMVGRTSFAVPDSFLTTPNFMMDRQSARKNVSVGAQAELLRGISRQIRFHRDWEKNQYDVSLGAISLGEFLKDYKGGKDVASPLLPKDIVFSLALANAGGILQNIVLDLSPAFLRLENNEVLWGNQYQEIKGDKVSTVAGMVEIVDGKRTSLIKTADIARFVLALDEFAQATDGMEQTNSALLKTPTKDGKSTMIADLIEIRKQLLLLQMSLSNYLVQVAQQKGGGFISRFELGGDNKIVPQSGNRRLEDHLLAIRALLASSKSLELPLLRTAALRGYYHLNRKFFDPAKQFYASEVTLEGKPVAAASLGEVALALQAGEELSQHMPADTRKQWEKLSAPWFRALQEL